MERDERIVRLFGRNSEAEYELDLKGLDRAHAEASVERMLERNRFRTPRSVRVIVDAPKGDGAESLFQPIGRMLLEARRVGVLSRLSTLPPDGERGFLLTTTGKPDAAPD